MTVTSSTNSASYAGNGVSTDFTVPFRFLDNSHLRVVLVDADGTEHVQVLNTDYTASGAGNATGDITFSIAPANGKTVQIFRNVPITQEKDYVTGDKFPAESHEQALDKLTMIAQQQREVLDRAWTSPVGTPGGKIAVGVASTVPVFDADGNLVEGPSAAEIEHAEGYAGEAHGYRDVSEAAAARAQGYAAMLSADKVKFKTVPLLLADETLSYTPGAGLIEVGEGDIVEAQGFRYEVAASGATDAHVETAGGVKLYVLSASGVVSVEQFGIFGDGTDRTAQINQLFSLAPASNFKQIDFPSGEYIVDGETGLTPCSNIVINCLKECVFKALPKEYSLDFRVILILEQNSIRIQGGTIDGNRDDEDVSSSTGRGFGIEARVFSDVVLDGVTVLDNFTDGIYFGRIEGQEENNRGAIVNCTIKRSRRNNISVVAGDSITIKNNNILEIVLEESVAPYSGIDIEETSTGIVGSVIVSENYVKDCYTGININDASGPVIVSGNIVIDAVYSAFRTSYLGESLSMFGNIARGGGADCQFRIRGNPSTSAKGFLFANNRGENSTTSAFGYINIDGVISEGNVAIEPAINGHQVDENVKNLTINGGMVVDAGQDGVWAAYEDRSGFTVNNVLILRPVRRGVTCGSGDGGDALNGLRIVDPGQLAIQTDTVGGTVMTHCRIEGAARNTVTSMVLLRGPNDVVDSCVFRKGDGSATYCIDTQSAATDAVIRFNDFDAGNISTAIHNIRSGTKIYLNEGYDDPYLPVDPSA